MIAIEICSHRQMTKTQLRFISDLSNVSGMNVYYSRIQRLKTRFVRKGQDVLAEFTFMTGYACVKEIADLNHLRETFLFNTIKDYLSQLYTHDHPGLVDREDERKGQSSKAPCLIPAATLKTILKALAPLGAGVSVIAPLPERLPGLIEGSLRPQSSFEYSVPYK